VSEQTPRSQAVVFAQAIGINTEQNVNALLQTGFEDQKMFVQALQSSEAKLLWDELRAQGMGLAAWVLLKQHVSKGAR